MSGDRVTFKDMCDRFNVTPRTLRYYEYIELLQPAREGRSRLFAAREVARMTLILRGRRFGFSLEEIRQWLLLYEEEGSEAQTRAFIAMAERQLSVLSAQHEELAATIEELRDLRHEAVDGLAEQGKDRASAAARAK